MAQIGGVTALALLVAGRTPAARLPHAPVPAGTARSVGELKFCIRDVSTGYGVRAVILLYPTQGVGPDRSGGRWVPPRTNPLVLQSDPQGRGRYKLPARAYLAEVSAQGYLPLRTDWVIDAGSTLPTTVMMEPERPPEELRKEVLERKCRPGFALVYGFVVDAATLSPLPNVRIVVREAGTEAGRATTNPRGYFEILVPVHPIAPVPAPAEAPYALADLLAGAPGYKKYIVRNEVLVDGGGVGFNADMEPGRGRQERDVMPMPLGGPKKSRRRSVSAAEHFEPLSENVGADVRAWLSGAELGTREARTVRPSALRIEHDQGAVEIVVYNRAILLFTTDTEAVKRVHQVCSQ